MRYEQGSGSGLNSRDKNHTGMSRLPPGPTYYYCKRRGHVKAQCPALEKKNKSNAIVTHPRPGNEECMVKPGKVPSEYKPFVSQGTVSLASGEESPVTILRDTGASQSLILADVLPFSVHSATGTSVLLQGVEISTMSVPLHKIILKCNLVNGPVVVGVRPSYRCKELQCFWEMI